MAKTVHLIGLGALLLMGTGCDFDQRISHLEKQTQELQAKVVKESTVAEYDLQAKCSRDARTWFSENWSSARDKSTTLLDYTNHYHKNLNKCFILVEYHYSVDASSSWMNDMTLWDVYENSKYGNFAESHTIRFKPTVDSHDEVITCELLGKKCKTIEEFNNFTRSYLND